MKGLLIRLDDEGAASVHDFTGELPELQAAVGGYIEAFPTREGRTLYINEEGKLLDLPRNYLAEDIVRRWDIGVLLHGDYIAGSAVLVGGTDSQGDTLDLDAADRRWAIRVAAEAGALEEMNHA